MKAKLNVCASEQAQREVDKKERSKPYTLTTFYIIYVLIVPNMYS
jgi:hypothetical protein